jgi:hypothetical protein
MYRSDGRHFVPDQIIEEFLDHFAIGTPDMVILLYERMQLHACPLLLLYH